jgi:polysaccharide pyruvyl transferase WcaK-like protein
VFVRETRSQKALAAQGIRAQVVPDVSLSLPFSAAEYGRRSGNIFTDSVAEEIASSLYEASKLVEDSHFMTLTVPSMNKPITHDTGGPLKVPNIANDRTGKKRPPKKSEPPFRLPTHATLTELLHCVATSRCVVTGRFHMVCLALLARTPFMAVQSNTHKIEGLLGDVGLQHRFISCQKVQQSLPQLSCWHEGEAELVETYLCRARRLIGEMFSAIRSSVSVSSILV